MPTLGEYRDIYCALAGENSKAVAFIDKKIAEQGRDMEVLADESQMVALLAAFMKED